MMYLIFLLSFSSALLHGMEQSIKPYQLPQPSDNADKTQGICAVVLKMVKPIDITESTLGHINEFFKQKGITDYQSAVNVGGKEVFIANPEEFNREMMQYFPHLTNDESGEDIVPHSPREYQAVIMPLSGIDGYVRRLAAFKKLFLLKGFTARKIVTLVAGEHMHRKDLMDKDYLAQLPLLFASDLDIQESEEVLRHKAQELLKKESWTLEDGAQAAWNLVESDSSMKEAYKSFSYFRKEKCSPKELFESFAKEGLGKSISKENPIAFITQNFGFANLKKTTDEAFGNAHDAVDFFIPQDLSPEIQLKLFRQTPHQEAVVRLYQLRNMLLKKVSNK